MYGYILITVEEHHISTKQFNSFDEARKKMVSELKQYLKCYGLEKDFSNTGLSQSYYEYDEQGNWIFAIGYNWALSNIDDWSMSQLNNYQKNYYSCSFLNSSNFYT